MSTEEANASWHPAWMPNSGQEDSSATHNEPTVPETTAEPVEQAVAMPSPSHKDLDPIDTQADPENDESLEHNMESATDNDNHPELNNLRSALTTSLASPGGVEMDESPVHNNDLSSGQAEGIIEHTDTEVPEKAEFPTRGPAQEINHTSNQSFTRTKVDAIDWGEDDEVDPEWNLHRTDTDPFKFMGQANRSNSFPAVPPAHNQSAFHADHPLAHSQAESIIEEMEQKRNPFEDDDAAGEDFFAQQANAEEPAHEMSDIIQNDFQSQAGQDIADDYGRTLGGDAMNEEEDRYEEGLPLVSHENQSEETPEQADVEVAPFADDDGADDDFFSGIGNKTEESPSSFQQPPSLDRKTTMQVMGSMKFEDHQNDDENDNDPDEIAEEPEAEAEAEKGSRRPSSFHMATGGGIAVSASTIASQVLGDPDAPIHEDSEAQDNAPSEVDLAAKWKAALEADDLLDDDDELLPDDEPEEKALDPAAFFGSDDEGFLDDDANDQTHGPSSQDSGSPNVAPVYDANGQMTGFDKLTSRPKPTSNGSINKYLPQGATPGSAQPANPYTPTAPFLNDHSGQFRPGMPHSGTGSYGFPSAATPPTGLFFSPAEQSARPDLPKAQSFVNKSKGGYSSPYDLPMEVVKPRKRASMQQLPRSNTQQAAMPPPPPRSASTYNQEPQPSAMSLPGISPPISGQTAKPLPGQLTSAPSAASRPPQTLRKSQSFFEELPTTSKPKPAGRYTPQPSQLTPGPFTANTPQQFPSAPPQGAPQNFQPPPSRSIPPNTYAAPPAAQPFPAASHGLVAPPPVNPYASVQAGNIPLNAPPPIAAQRYSPAPPTSNLSAPPPPTSRYSPAPPAQRPVMPGHQATAPSGYPPSIMAHQPRTSSPLAYFEKNQGQSSTSAAERRANAERRQNSMGYDTNLDSAQNMPRAREVDQHTESQHQNHNDQMRPLSDTSAQSQMHPPNAHNAYTPPPPLAAGPGFQASPAKRATSSYLPQKQLSYGQEPQDAQVPRAQSQSPIAPLHNAQTFGLNTTDPYQRSVSAQNLGSPISPTTTFSPIAASLGHRRAPSKPLNYVSPTDGREQDPMQRWKGYPIFNWGAGGCVVTSFPKEVPRYTIGQVAPMITCAPGEVKSRSIKDLFPLPERLSGFPGPLKGKSKKKEVVTWLSSGIENLEREFSHLAHTSNLSHDNKRDEERILLWKILRVFVENNGTLEGSANADQAVRAILSPGLDGEGQSEEPIYASGADSSSIIPSATTDTKAEARDPASVDNLRKFLLRGDREKAVWEAVDKRLWAHAMLIANTVSPDLYKQVAGEFIQKEVKGVGENTESLAALYEIFAGNFEESIDELVPPSARAGFQMVSTSSSTATTKNAVDGLDRWRETLGLVLSNRSTGDGQALNALGKLLSSYERAEAAHICFIFGRSHSLFSGIDDPASNIVLVGADHLKQGHDFQKDLEPILLSEVYEYGLSLHTATLTMPHLSAYKLQHATILAEYGYRDNALAYCEAVAGSMTSQTRRSPYHNTHLVSALDDLSKRLKQSPKDENSSWISKPSIDKVSGSVWAKFNKFVAGDENDASNGTGTEGFTESGPFAKIAGDTPTISRSPSINDFPSYPGSAPIPMSSTAGRYAPGSQAGGSYTPLTYEPQLSSSYNSQSRRSLEQRPTDYRRGSYEPQRASSEYRPFSQPSSYTSNSYMAQAQQPPAPQGPPNPYAPRDGSSFESTPSHAASQPMTPATETPLNNFHNSPALSQFGQSSSGPEAPMAMNDSPSYGYEPPATNSSEPPASNGYEPPSYEPVSFDQEPDSPIDTRPKKKTFMDDDDEDDIPALKNLPKPTEKTKAEKDREADEAFRKAAEEDTKRAAAAAPAKKGWGLGGWFAKKEATPEPSQPGKPIKAKLGEQSSFYYDPDLKRWINKKDKGSATAAASATPPPPKGPPRSASGPPGNAGLPMPPPPATRPGMPPTTGSAPPLQRNISNPSNAGSPLLQPQGSPTPDSNGGLAAPPLMQRSVSNISLGPPSGPPSRPNTGMSNASSIDDLLGAPTARKGASKAKKKGRGYVDVMAK